MNILILTRTFGIGGVSVVSAILANKFKREGHKVAIWAFYEGQSSSRSLLDDGIELVYGHGFKYSSKNVQSLRTMLVKHKIEVVINQWGLPYVPIITARKASQGMNIKMVTVYHNAPASNGKLQEVRTALACCKNPIKRWVQRSKEWLFRTIASTSMRYVYHRSDLYLVLSDSFVEEFKKFTRLKQPSHLMVQTNPVTLDIADVVYAPAIKEKEMLYVGRLDAVQKKVERIICTWNLLERDHPDWRLTIVGDGPDRQHLEEMVTNMGLKRVTFEGFRSPIAYYKRASLLILTSDFEGFPLVLPESMSLGVVPVVYDSYAAVKDVIKDGKNGLILPFHKNGFDEREAAEKITALMNDPGRLNAMAFAAIEQSKKFSLDRIYEEWMEKLKQLSLKSNR